MPRPTRVDPRVPTRVEARVPTDRAVPPVKAPASPAMESAAAGPNHLDCQTSIGIGHGGRRRAWNRVRRVRPQHQRHEAEERECDHGLVRHERFFPRFGVGPDLSPFTAEQAKGH